MFNQNFRKEDIFNKENFQYGMNPNKKRQNKLFKSESKFLKKRKNTNSLLEESESDPKSFKKQKPVLSNDNICKTCNTVMKKKRGFNFFNLFI